MAATLAQLRLEREAREAAKVAKEAAVAAPAAPAAAESVAVPAAPAPSAESVESVAPAPAAPAMSWAAAVLARPPSPAAGAPVVSNVWIKPLATAGLRIQVPEPAVAAKDVEMATVVEEQTEDIFSSFSAYPALPGSASSKGATPPASPRSPTPKSPGPKSWAAVASPTASAAGDPHATTLGDLQGRASELLAGLEAAASANDADGDEIMSQASYSNTGLLSDVSDLGSSVASVKFGEEPRSVRDRGAEMNTIVEEENADFEATEAAVEGAAGTADAAPADGAFTMPTPSAVDFECSTCFDDYSAGVPCVAAGVVPQSTNPTCAQCYNHFLATSGDSADGVGASAPAATVDIFDPFQSSVPTTACAACAPAPAEAPAAQAPAAQQTLTEAQKQQQEELDALSPSELLELRQELRRIHASRLRARKRNAEAKRKSNPLYLDNLLDKIFGRDGGKGDEANGDLFTDKKPLAYWDCPDCEAEAKAAKEAAAPSMDTDEGEAASSSISTKTSYKDYESTAIASLPDVLPVQYKIFDANFNKMKYLASNPGGEGKINGKYAQEAEAYKKELVRRLQEVPSTSSSTSSRSASPSSGAESLGSAAVVGEEKPVLRKFTSAEKARFARAACAGAAQLHVVDATDALDDAMEVEDSEFELVAEESAQEAFIANLATSEGESASGIKVTCDGTGDVTKHKVEIEDDGLEDLDIVLTASEDGEAEKSLLTDAQRARYETIVEELKDEQTEYFAAPDFPVTGLDLTRFLAPESADRLKPEEDRLYDLVGTVLHHGSFQGGHYTSISKRGDTWFHFDDSSVTRIGGDSVLESGYLLDDKSWRSDIFYIVYVRRSALRNTPLAVKKAAERAARRVPLPELLYARGELEHLERVRDRLGLGLSEVESVEEEVVDGDGSGEEEADNDEIMSNSDGEAGAPIGFAAHGHHEAPADTRAAAFGGNPWDVSVRSAEPAAQTGLGGTQHGGSLWTAAGNAGNDLDDDDDIYN